ncbi:AAA family ATPase [Anaerosalibacter bizertensis]|uniref:Nuclease SbcCD subunit C n=1 Tax=Anaerosalibacter bizertensis TaxID=932217 RepID=A0A844FG61_9FIRM|nr:AAA family ATPase [Anaerosalibacter bizertensis]MBU5293235.1 AAA family ATPase [Anaerosalibacter bizertensis]MCG4564592.1 AAA family ATPase [Anaerosalibacter bizertensis]MSS42945.1 AAA family ATPase [Anaerosalibacter bizertensis]HHV27295.1 AAA family ATPase [Tissierellia bacterium]
MKYIKKVVLENFQSHKYTELEFDERLNVIVGPSDQGKSAIIRGIKWALFNEPSGNFFIREGENDCSVTIVFNDNTKIKRYKSKSKNLYYLYNSENKEQIFEGFGTNVPKEIIEATNIRKVYLDGKQTNSINISDQLEGPFLLSEKTATRANSIGRLVGVHIVDDAVGDTLKDIRNLNLSKRNLTEQLNKLEENLKEYDYLEQLQKKVKILEEIKIKIKESQEKVGKLKNIKLKYVDTEKQISNTKKLIGELNSVDVVENIANDLNVKVKVYNFMNNKRKHLLDINKSICYNVNIINSLKNLNQTSQFIIELEDKVYKKRRLENINSNYKSIAKNIIVNNNIVNKLENIDIVESKTYSIYEYSKRLMELKTIKKKFHENYIRTTYGFNYLEKFSKLDQADSILYNLETKVSNLLTLANIKNKTSFIQSELDSTVKNIEKENLQIKKLLEEYKILLEQFEVCPVCFHKIDNKTIEEIINNYS